MSAAPTDFFARWLPRLRALGLSLVLPWIVGCGAPEDKDFSYPRHRIPLPEEAMEFFKANPDFFVWADRSQIPANLDWQDGAEVPEIGSHDAQKGGTYYYVIPDFPRTLRFVGPDANGAFRNNVHDNNTLALVGTHPDNPEHHFPSLARQWAIGEDRRTVYFQLDPDATYSDGVPIRADDYFFCFFFMRSPHIVDPWYNDAYKTKISKITQFDELTIAITLPEAKPDLLYRTTLVRPVPTHFYRDFAEDYVRLYQWQMEPTTGAYHVLEENIVKGRSIALTKVPNWWARDKRQFRFRYNPDRLDYRVVRDRDKIIALFKKDELDLYGANGIVPDVWYNKLSDSEPNVANGGIVRTTFYNQVPRPSWGMNINSMMPILKNRSVRQGLQHATNWDLVCQTYFRGDAQRMQTTSDGYVAVTFPDIKARPFDPALAAARFAEAGFTERGPDGILRNAAGERLSFTITTGYKRLADALTILQQEARKAGVEYRLEILDATAAWKKIDEKKHEISFGAKNTSVELYPRFWETFHGANAFKPDGSVQTETNNETQTNDPHLNALIEKYDRASSMEDIVRLAREIVAWLHEDAAFIPAFTEPFFRTAYWRWVKWPEGFQGKTARDADENMLFWIDTAERDATREALQRGESFPVQVHVFDQFRSP
ncbi:MAG: ABC transporter substrate-binding protein [Verrucomicrobiales bacterium]